MKQVIEKILGGWPGGQKITNEPVLSNFKFQDNCLFLPILQTAMQTLIIKNFKFGNLKVLLYDDDVTKCVF